MKQHHCIMFPELFTYLVFSPKNAPNLKNSKLFHSIEFQTNSRLGIFLSLKYVGKILQGYAVIHQNFDIPHPQKPGEFVLEFIMQPKPQTLFLSIFSRNQQFATHFPAIKVRRKKHMILISSNGVLCKHFLGGLQA